MKKFKKKVLNSSNGITLIALVITIIVLLILAGISISMLSGENGILQRATDAKTKSDEAHIRERIRLAYNASMITGNGTITEEALKTELTKEFGEEGTDYTIKGSKDGKSWEITVNEITEIVSKSAELVALGNNLIQLSAEEIETESRATLIKVTAKVSPTKEEYLLSERRKHREEVQNLNYEELGNYYANTITHGSCTTFAEMYKNAPFSSIDDYYENYGLKSSGDYEDVYDYVLAQIYNNELTNQYNQKYGDIELNFMGENKKIKANENEYAEFIITNNGSYSLSATDGDGDTGYKIIQITKCKVEEFSKIAEKLIYLKKGTDGKLIEAMANEDYVAVVPRGFAYGVSTNVGTVEKGLVITDCVDGKNSIGNEFVWVPMDKGTLNVRGTNKPIARQRSGVDEKGNANYRGNLYTKWEVDSTYSDISYYQEPFFKRDSDYPAGTASLSEKIFVESYNEMIKSVIQYGGFYIGRYEMGKGDGIFSKIAVLPTSASENDENRWYGLYKKAYSYVKEGITSNMMWGSQYDALLNFGLTNPEDRGKVNSTLKNLSKMKMTWTGACKEDDSINNVFDLGGNIYELTQEGYTYDTKKVMRGIRGGFASLTENGNQFPRSRRSSIYAYQTNDNFSTRVSFYINP